MNITLNIEAGSPAELQEAITGLAGIVGNVTTPTPEQKTVTEPVKQSIKPEKKPDPKPVDNSEIEVIPSIVELRAKAQEKGKTPEGKKAIKALLEEFGSKSISDVPEEQRAAFLAALEDL